MKSKRKVTISASELIDVDVDLISLVGRPASRVPFGLMKSDQPAGGSKMFDMNLKTLFKSEPVAPVVTSVIVNGTASEGVLAILKAEGFDTDVAQGQDGVTIYPQETAYHGEVSLVKLTENIAMTVPVVKAEGSFAEMYQARGFYPALSIATELLQSELSSCIYKSDSPSVASEKADAVISDFKQFMTSIIGGLPQQVFKAEEALASEEEPVADVAKEEEPAAGEDTGEEGEVSVDDDAGDENAQDEEIEKSSVAAGGYDPAAPMVEDEEEDSMTAAKKKKGKKPAFMKSEDGEPAADEGSEPAAAPSIDTDALVAAISKSVVDSFKPQLDSMQSAIEAQVERVNQIEGIAKSADKAVNGTLLGGVFGNDGNSRPVAKADDEQERPIDTGLSRV